SSRLNSETPIAKAVGVLFVLEKSILRLGTKYRMHNPGGAVLSRAKPDDHPLAEAAPAYWGRLFPFLVAVSSASGSGRYLPAAKGCNRPRTAFRENQPMRHFFGRYGGFFVSGVLFTTRQVPV
ncbi:hypothetical protein, partial [Pseudomonas sp. efr-133-R2A-59]|uniref:hypothetical protein n=1 Tax=Pseudomonas sp. efr-133-R2A-59 TaxID=3040307 RepID=UPI0025527BA4